MGKEISSTVIQVNSSISEEFHDEVNDVFTNEKADMKEDELDKSLSIIGECVKDLFHARDSSKENKDVMAEPVSCCSFGYMVNKSVEIIAAKDAQIEELESQLKARNENIEKMEKMNTSLVLKLQEITTNQEKKTDMILKLIQTIKEQGERQESEIASVKDEIKNINKGVNVSRPVEVRTPSQEKWNVECSKILLIVADKLQKTEDQIKNLGKTASIQPKLNPEPVQLNDQGLTPSQGEQSEAKRKRSEVIIVGDSNAQKLKPELLHDSKKVYIVKRYTLDEAKEKIPKWKEPEKVTDVIFLTGLNNSLNSLESVDNILTKQKEVCQVYRNTFGKAKLHIGAVAPFTIKEKNLNKRLHDYCQKADISFINNKGIFDRDSGAVRSGMLNGYHYTETATKILAKEIKHNLYGFKGALTSNRVRRSANLTQFSPRQGTASATGNSNSTGGIGITNSTQGLMSALEGFFKKAEQMIDRHTPL